MVEVEMGGEDVAHVGRGAQALDLADGGLLAQPDVEHRAHGPGDARPGAVIGVADVLEALARVDQDESLTGLDQPATADQAPSHAPAPAVQQAAAERTVGAAVEMVDSQS